MSRVQVFTLGFVSAVALMIALRGISATPAGSELLQPAVDPQPQDAIPEPGMFLVATRALNDPWFGQSVVLLLEITASPGGRGKSVRPWGRWRAATACPAHRSSF